MQNQTQFDLNSINPLSEKEIKFSKNENVMTVLTGPLKGKYYAREVIYGCCTYCCFFNLPGSKRACSLITTTSEGSRCVAADRKLNNLITWHTTPDQKLNRTLATPTKRKTK